jgi:RNA polymerase sigma-70 factor, ECF subfamily
MSISGYYMSCKDDFLRLFLKHNNLLFAFIFTLVPNHADAEDILQDTAATLWNKFDEYQSGTNFMAWAKQTARYKILNYYTKKKPVIQFDEDIVEKLALLNEKVLDRYEQQKSALQGCLKKLDSKNIKLVLMRFHQGISIKKIAEQSGESSNTLYKRMPAILSLLRECVHKTLLSWE